MDHPQFFNFIIARFFSQASLYWLLAIFWLVSYAWCLCWWLWQMCETNHVLFAFCCLIFSTIDGVSVHFWAPMGSLFGCCNSTLYKLRFHLIGDVVAISLHFWKPVLRSSFDMLVSIGGSLGWFNTWMTFWVASEWCLIVFMDLTILSICDFLLSWGCCGFLDSLFLFSLLSSNHRLCWESLIFFSHNSGQSMLQVLQNKLIVVSFVPSPTFFSMPFHSFEMLSLIECWPMLLSLIIL